jgi:plastocyanin
MAVVAIVVIGIVVFVSSYLSSQAHSAANGLSACPKVGINHTVTIRNDMAVPQHTQAALCDTLTITNTDDEVRLIAFGPHSHHQAYDGITEELVGQGQSVKVTLNKSGTYPFHDHIHDEMTGDFTVAP